MKHWLFNTFGGVKGILFSLAIGIALFLHFYTQRVVKGLREEARSLVTFYAQMYARVAETESSEDLSFLFDQIIRRTTFPLIQTDTLKHPVGWKGLSVDSEDTSRLAYEKVQKIVDRLDKSIDPIPVRYGNRTLAYLYYGDSKLIQELQWLPYVEIGFVALFVLIGFLGYAHIQRSQQRSIWVGMAKETAHQLGTPISSLLGWLELLKTGQGPKKALIYEEMVNDLKRLQQVTQRFSQIGSRPDLVKQSVEPVLRTAAEYIRRRAPQLGKPVEVIENYGETVPVLVNPGLFQWAIENMLKNALDAMDKKEGRIEIRTGMTHRNRVFVEIIDNGRGFDPSLKKRIFRPGYSTKTRGWGLGLALAKRIIEEYHGGRVYVKDTIPGKGSTFRVEL